MVAVTPLDVEKTGKSVSGVTGVPVETSAMPATALTTIIP